MTSNPIIPARTSARLDSVPGSRLGLVVLVVANLAIGLLAATRRWGYYQMVLIYWLEALIIGGYNVLRLLVVGMFGDQPFGAWLSRNIAFAFPFSRYFYTLLGTGFFAFKFGVFSLGVGMLVMALPAAFAPAGDSQAVHAFRALKAAGPGAGYAVGMLVLSHGVSFVRNFLMGREYQRMSIPGLIFWPYLRMCLVALVLGIGYLFASLVPGAAGSLVFGTVMVLLKTIADGASHLLEHRRFGAAAGEAGGS